MDVVLAAAALAYAHALAGEEAAHAASTQEACGHEELARGAFGGHDVAAAILDDLARDLVDAHVLGLAQGLLGVEEAVVRGDEDVRGAEVLDDGPHGGDELLHGIAAALEDPALRALLVA